MSFREDGAVRAWRALFHSSLAVGGRLRQLFEEHGLSGAQFRVLGLLGEAGTEGIKLSKLGCRLRVTPGNITGLVDRLEETGHVVREPHATDRRVQLARLTPQGQELLDQVMPVYRARVQDLMSCLSDEEKATLEELLTRVVASVVERDDPATRRRPAD